MQKQVGLYQLIGGAKNGDLTSQDILKAIKPEMSLEDRERLLAWAKDLGELWEPYAEIYFNLEKARPYHNLAKSIERFINPQKGDIWLDVACGPAKMSEMIYKKSRGEVEKVIAIDIILKPAKERLARLNTSMPIELKCASITDPLPFPDNFFDGIVANLCLPYVIDFEGKRGRDAFEAVLREMFRILKPGGHMIWSTPKANVHFQWNFVASIPDMLNVWEYIYHKDITRILQGTTILKHALKIQENGRKGIYTFLPKDELEELLLQIGFVNPVWEKTFTQQVWVNRVYKP